MDVETGDSLERKATNPFTLRRFGRSLRPLGILYQAEGAMKDFKKFEPVIFDYGGPADFIFKSLVRLGGWSIDLGTMYEFYRVTKSDNIEFPEITIAYTTLLGLRFVGRTLMELTREMCSERATKEYSENS